MELHNAEDCSVILPLKNDILIERSEPGHGLEEGLEDKEESIRIELGWNQCAIYLNLDF